MPDTPEMTDTTAQAEPTPQPRLTPGFLARASAGGVLMGLANLVPGISGGTMLVATGVYTRFIDSISDITRLRLKPAPILTLATIALSAAVAIGGLAGVISNALAGFRWGMYSLFIGLTLGGVPIMLKLVRPMSTAAFAGLAAGIAAMLALVALQAATDTGSASSTSPAMLALAGAAGASAMILPGVSGAYLLLLLGQYENVINGVKDFVSAAKDADLDAVTASLSVLVPVGIGVVLGVVVIGNLLRFVLHRYEKATLGVLLGLLIAAPAGLYPFKQGQQPRVGETFEGQVVTEETLPEIDPKDWPETYFSPTPGHIAGSLALIAAGFAATLAIGRLGTARNASNASAS